MARLLRTRSFAARSDRNKLSSSVRLSHSTATTAKGRLAHPLPSQEVIVLTLREAQNQLTTWGRQDLYNVRLVLESDNTLRYPIGNYVITRPALVFATSQLPHDGEREAAAPEPEGYICFFTEAFLHSAMRGVSLHNFVLHKAIGSPVYLLSDEQQGYFTRVFARMRRDLHSNYVYKYDLLRNHLSITLNELARAGADASST